MQILLAIDASSASQTAVQEVARRSWPAGSTCQVLNVVALAPPWTLAEEGGVLESRGQKLVNAAAETLCSAGFEASGAVLAGDPKSVILDRAAEVRADLIVMGAQGVSAIQRFLMGSVARAVLRHAPCSVEIVRPPVKRDEPGMRILLAVDGSAAAQYAAESVAARPWPAGTEVRVLSAVELALSAFQSAFEIPGLDSARLEQQRAEAMKRTEDAINAAETILQGAGLKTSESISVLVAKPEEIILGEAATWHADLAVVGSHGHGTLDRFLLGSVSEAVALHAGCSVEVIRKPAG